MQATTACGAVSQRVTDGLLVAIGIAVLLAGGELVVRGASRLALGLGLSPVVVGLTVVAFGTSSPELAIAVGATVGGQPDVAVGNVVGSNIYNILLILGMAAVLRSLVVRQRLVRFDVPLVIVISLLLWVLVLDGKLAPLEGALLLAVLGVYVTITVRVGRREAAGVQDQYRGELGAAVAGGRERLRDGALFAAGLAALVVGSQLLVTGASSMARALGVSELVVGLTVVAIGTSLPELVTSAIATLRDHRDIAVGNVMGSNLFNILGILGLSAIVAPGGLPIAEQLRAFDLPVMTAVAIACLPLLFTGYELRRWEGLVFVAYAVLYTVYVVLEATDDPLGDQFRVAMLLFVLPLTVLTIATVVVRERAARRRLRRRPG